MSKRIILSCESTVDLPYDYLQKRDISVIKYSYVIDGIEKEDNMQRDETETKSFYEAFDQGKKPTTSQINMQRYEDYFKQFDSDCVVLHLAFSSGLTPSVENAKKSAKLLNDLYNEERIIVIDTFCASSGYGMLVDSVKDMIDNGESIENILMWVENNKRKIQHIFFVSDITTLKKSGRIKGAIAVISAILNICPVLKLNKNGQIVSNGVARGKKNAIKKLVTSFSELSSFDDKYKNKIIISHSNCIDLALETKLLLESNLNNKDIEVKISEIGCVVGSHCGAGVVVLFFYGQERDD